MHGVWPYSIPSLVSIASISTLALSVPHTECGVGNLYPATSEHFPRVAYVQASKHCKREERESGVTHSLTIFALVRQRRDTGAIDINYLSID